MIGLFALYLRVSRTLPENSDEANILLMAWDMLHGHVLLPGWVLSDVSFYTTELPQYAVLEKVFGLRTETAHVGAAMTYTLVVLLAAMLARGRKDQADRAEGTVRMLLTAGILIAPQLGAGVFILLLSVGHIGTAVPLMLAWLVIDRGRRRWREPVAVGLVLAWALVADPLVLVVGIVPLAAVCLLRAGRVFHALPREVRVSVWMRAGLRASGYELALGAAAGTAYVVGTVADALLRSSGAFQVNTLVYRLASPGTWAGNAWQTARGWLTLFGAEPGGSGPQTAFAVLHLAGVALVTVAMWQVARRFFGHRGLIDQVLLVAIVLNVLVYVPSTLANATSLNAREFAVALPFGAVLAGRTLAARVRSVRLAAGRAGRWTTWALTGVMAGYLAGFGYAAAQAPAPPDVQRLTGWLAAHKLSYGIGGYWQSSIVTVESHYQVIIRAVRPKTLRRYMWESKYSWYDPAPHAATFLVTDSAPEFGGNWLPNPAAVADFGRPAQTYHVGPYMIYVWRGNLLYGPGHHAAVAVATRTCRAFGTPDCHRAGLVFDRPK